MPGQQFRFPKEKGYFPRRPSTAGNPRSRPAALGTPRLHSVPAGDLPTRLRSPPGSREVPWGPGAPEGRCHRNSVQDPRPGRGRRKRKARDTRRAQCDHVPPFPLGAAARSPQRPHSSRAVPRGSTKTLPSAMSARPGPACSLARSAPLNRGGRVTEAAGLARVMGVQAKGGA